MKKNIGLFLAIIGLTIFIVLVLSLPTMWLWNYVMPVVFNLPEISLVQAIALLVLAELFFKNNKGKIKE